jgi:hypothetical protein
MLSVIMLSVIMLSVIMLSVAVLSVVMLSVMVPKLHQSRQYYYGNKNCKKQVSIWVKASFSTQTEV